MNILLVTQHYHPFVGGIESHVRQIAHRFAVQHTVEVAAVNFAPSRVSPRLGVLANNLLIPSFASYDDEGVPVHALTPTRLERLRMAPIATRALPRVQRYAYHALNRFGYRSYRAVFAPKLCRLTAGKEIVHSLAGGYIGWAAQEAARSHGLPFVCTPFVHPKQWGDGPDDVAYYKRSDAVIALVDTDRDYLVSLGVPREKVHVIGVSPDLPDASDPDGFRTRYGLGGVPLVLYVGRMTPHKGAEAVLAAAPLVWKTQPQAHFVFIGPHSPESEQWFTQADPRIHYLGKVSAQEKADALDACDIFCMPSVSEILPTVYLEAWSFGKPVIGGRAPGLPELVEGNGAGRALGQEPGALSEALVCLLSDSTLRARYGEAGRSLVSRKYSPAAVSRSLEDLYRELMPHPGQPGLATVQDL